MGSRLCFLRSPGIIVRGEVRCIYSSHFFCLCPSSFVGGWSQRRVERETHWLFALVIWPLIAIFVCSTDNRSRRSSAPPLLRSGGGLFVVRRTAHRLRGSRACARGVDILDVASCLAPLSWRFVPTGCCFGNRERKCLAPNHAWMLSVSQGG